MSRKQSQFPEKLSMVDADEFAIYDSETAIPNQQNASVKKSVALPTLPTNAQKAALDGANFPSGSNVFATDTEITEAKARANHTGTQSLSTISDAGTAAAEDVGATIGDVVQLENVGGTPGLPAVDGSQLTNLPGGGTDELVGVTTNDTTPGFLQSKLTSGDASINFTVNNPGANEVLDIRSTGAGGGEANRGENLGTTPDGESYAGMNGVNLTFRGLFDTTSASWTQTATNLSVAVNFGATAGVACEGNDARLPTSDEKAAMTASTSPSGANEFVTQSVLDAAIAVLESRLLPATANEGDIVKYTGGQWVASSVLDGGGA